jgi:ATP-binding cassette subfamily B protein RaxB
VEAIIDGMMTIVTLAMMLFYSWKLALFTLAAVFIYAVLRAIAYRPMRDTTEKQLLAGAKQQSHLLESIRGIQSVKLAGSEPTRKSVYSNLMNDTLNNELSLAKLGLGFNSANQLVFGLERISVIWFGATLAMSNIFSVGMLIAYLSYKDQFTGRVSGLIDKAIEFRMLRLHGERLSDIVLTEPEASVNGHLEIDHKDLASLNVSALSFRYSDGDPLVIQDCTFDIKDGEFVAIIGASGCGKTTLVKLMLGLLKPESGKIQFSEQDITQLGMTNYRRHVGSVMQDDQLFAGSIADNISFFDENIDIERIEQAARMAAIHDEIIAMPMAYHSLIGDMGTSLSGGQKQRVILARALYRQPKILFLDEATSHLDIHNERLVNDAVKQLNITKIIIAHRPETIASADRVLVMQGGKIVQDTRQSSLAKAELAL